MAPSRHRPLRFARVHHQVRGQDTLLQASSTSLVSQDAQVPFSSADVEQKGSPARNVAVVATVVVVISLLFAITAALFLMRYKRRSRKSRPQTVPFNSSWIDVCPNRVGIPGSIRSAPTKEKTLSFDEWKAENEARARPPPIPYSSPNPGSPQVPIRDMTDWAQFLETLPPNEDHEEHRSPQSPPESPFNFHLPSFTFTLPSPVEPVTTCDSSIFEMNLDCHRDCPLDNHTSTLIAEKPFDNTLSSPDRKEGTLQSEASTISEVSFEETSRANGSQQLSDGPPIFERSLIEDSSGSIHSRLGAGESESSGWDLLTKLRKLLPSNTSLKSETFYETGPSSVAVQRSFTSPAFFTLVSPMSNKPATCLKPCIPEKKESVSSNLVLKFLESDTLGLDLMDESLPPPAIIVSPATASTLNLGQQSMSSLDRFADAADPWSIAYGIPPNATLTGAPTTLDVALSRRRGDSVVTHSSRPPKSHRRNYVQEAVSNY